MKISNASPEEFRELAEFARRTYEHAFGREIGLPALRLHLANNMSDERFKNMLSEDSFYLAHSNDQLVGFAQVGRVDAVYKDYLEEFDCNADELRRLYVEPKLQSQGIGSALIVQVIQSLSPTGGQSVYLTTWEANQGAHKLYIRHGFEKVGQIPEYSSDGTLNGYEHIMHRNL